MFPPEIYYVLANAFDLKLLIALISAVPSVDS
jgi:hypothetical protein